MVKHKTALVDGFSVFYREAGDPGAPRLLPLGGFPASSHQFVEDKLAEIVEAITRFHARRIVASRSRRAAAAG